MWTTTMALIEQSDRPVIFLSLLSRNNDHPARCYCVNRELESPSFMIRENRSQSD